MGAARASAAVAMPATAVRERDLRNNVLPPSCGGTRSWGSALAARAGGVRSRAATTYGRQEHVNKMTGVVCTRVLLSGATDGHPMAKGLPAGESEQTRYRRDAQRQLHTGVLRVCKGGGGTAPRESGATRRSRRPLLGTTALPRWDGGATAVHIRETMTFSLRRTGRPGSAPPGRDTCRGRPVRPWEHRPEHSGASRECGDPAGRVPDPGPATRPGRARAWHPRPRGAAGSP